MTSENKIQFKNSSQSGVTLMLAVLVLASITAVAFSLATIVFIEIRSAGDSSRTEPALYATLGVTEEALFQYKRAYDPIGGLNLNVPACQPANENVCLINGVTLTLPDIDGQPQPIAFDYSPREEFIGGNVTKILPMYVVNIYDEQQYKFLKVDVLPNESNAGIDISTNIYYADQLDPVPGFSGTASPGAPFSTSGFYSSGQYELILTNTTSQDITVVITTERVGDLQPAGLPFVGEQVLRIMADYVGLTRTYQVRIPIP